MKKILLALSLLASPAFANTICVGDLQIQCKQEVRSTELTIAAVEIPDVVVETTPGYAVRFELLGPAEFDAAATPVNGAFLGQGPKILVWRNLSARSALEGATIKLTSDADVADVVKARLTIYDPNGAAQTILQKEFDVVNVVGFERKTVFFFNPATNNTQFSLLRIVNDSQETGVVVIKGVDDSGFVSQPVQVLIPARGAIQLTATELEQGSSRLVGSLGRGVGKWRLTLDSDFVGLTVQSLVRNNVDGTITSVSDVVR